MGKQFTVTVRADVFKVVTCECDTEEQAREAPWDYAIDEYESEQMDWHVVDVKETTP